MSKCEPMLIFIDGTDRCGKGSLMQAIHKATEYKHVIFDRSPVSNMVYGMVNGRITGESMKLYEKLELQVAATNHIVIHLECETKELIRRKIATGHEYVNFNLHKELFNGYFATSSLNVVKINSTTLKPEQIAQKLIDKGLI